MKTSISVAEERVPLAMMMFKGDLESSLKRVASIGYDGVELYLFSAENTDAKRIKNLLDESGLGVGMLAANFDLIGADIVMGHPEAAVRQEFIRRAPPHLELAAQLGAVVPVGFSRGYVRPGTTEENVEAWFVDTLHEYGALAQHLGVTLVIEPINHYEINYINRIEEGLRVVRKVELPNVKLLLDSYHMNIEETSIARAISEAGPHIGHFHFVDSNRWPPGYGHTDMKEIYMHLKDVQYKGYLGVEAMPKPDAETGARCGLDYIHMLGRLAASYEAP